MTDIKTLRAWVVEEQGCLWGQLDEDLRRAMNGYWSMAMESTAERLVGCLRLVGALAPEEVPWRLWAGDIYATICRSAGVDFTEPSVEEWSRWDEIMHPYGGHRADLLTRFARTRAALQQALPVSG